MKIIDVNFKKACRSDTLQGRFDFAKVSLSFINDTKSLIDNFKIFFLQVFQETLGLCTKIKAHLYLKPNVKLVFILKRNVPTKSEAAVENKLSEKQTQKLTDLSVLKSVDYCDWAYSCC